MTYNMQDEMDRANEEYGGNGSRTDFFKFKEGENKLRILTSPLSYASHYKAGACIGKKDCPECKKTRKNTKGEDEPNNPSIKFLCHILDYSDNTIKIGQLPYGVFTALQSLQEDDDYTFDGFPMPYNIKIKAVGAGTTAVKYTVIASPKREDIAPDIIEKMSKLGTVENFRENMKKKELKKLGLLPSEEKDSEDMRSAFTAEEYPESTGEVAF